MVVAAGWTDAAFSGPPIREPAMTVQPRPSTPTPGPLDALLPPEMARKAEDTGVRKARADATSVFVLAVLAGAFIALGAIFSLTAAAGSMTVTDASGAIAHVTMPYGVTRLFAGLAFSLGLILVVIAGAELFTGNVLLVMAWASRRITMGSVLRNWAIVFAGNLVGSLGIVGLAFVAGWYRTGGGAVGRRPSPWRRARSSTRSSRPWPAGSCATRSSASPSG